VSIYALLSFMVTRRTGEIGIRVALGARRSQVLITVPGGTLAYVGVGTAMGRSDDAHDRDRRDGVRLPRCGVGADTPRA
jgi:hypothetical protein